MRRMMRTASTLALLSVLVVVATASAAPNPALDYDLTQGSGTTVVDAANGVVATTHGTQWATDPSGTDVLYFDNPIRYLFGDGDWVEIPDHAALDSPEVSVEVLVYPMSAGYYTSFVERIRDGGSWQTDLLLNMRATGYTTGQRPQFGLAMGTTSHSILGPDDLPLHAWSHVVGTYDGNDMKLYVDGELVAESLGVGGPRNTGSNPLYLGHAPSSNHYFNGYMASFKYYDRALTAAEIAAEFNSPPVADANGPYTGTEGIAVMLDATGSWDPDEANGDAIVAYEWDLDDDGLYDDATGATTSYVFGDDGVYTVGVRVTDGAGATDSAVATVTIGDAAHPVAVEPSTQTVQYSDAIADVAISASDVAADPLTLSTAWDVDGGGFTAGLPSGLTVADEGCEPAGGVQECSWMLGGVADVPTGTYTVRATVTDDDGVADSSDVVLTVDPEDATVSFPGAPHENPVAVQVAAPGGASGAFELTAMVSETAPDAAANGSGAGDITLADVSMSLTPVGPGGSFGPNGACTVTTEGTGYAGVQTVTCPFDGVATNTYSVTVTVGGGYLTGANDDVLVVYDPSLGFTTGGGWFYWPDTDDKTNFGYTMKYNNKGHKVHGNFVLIRHLDDGTHYRMKSNALYGLALGDDGGMGWATFTGKATYQEPGWAGPLGNHQFVVYVEDHATPGAGADRIWLEVSGPDGVVIPGFSMSGGTTGAETLSGGNVVVPH